MKSQLLSFLKFLIGWPFSFIAFFFIIKLILPQGPTILSYLRQMNITLFISGVFSFLIFYFLRSYIWYLLVKKYLREIQFKDACFLWATSELKRYVPGSVWSFLGRTLIFSKMGINKTDIAKTMAIEAELFVIGATCISVFSLPFLSRFKIFALPSFLQQFIYFLLFLFLLFYIFNRTIISKLPKKINVLARVALPQDVPSEILSLVCISTCALFFFGLGSYLTIASFIQIHPQLIIELSAFFVLALLIGYLSILTPAGFGVREAVTIVGISKIIPFSTAAFGALFSRIILVISELIFLFFAYLWYKSKNKVIAKLSNWIATHKHETVLFILFLVYTIYFVDVSFLRYDNFYTGRFDLGNMAQTVWNTTRGRIFLFTDPNGTDVISRLAFHADFLLILLAPFYFLWSDPKMLLLIQTIVLAAGAFFVFLIAKESTKNKNIALVFSFSYLLNASIERSNLYDFHAVTLSTTFLLATYYFYSKKKYVYFCLFALLAAICKEHLWIIIALFGIFLFIRQKKRILGSIVFLISAGMFYFLIWYAIPHALGAQHFALSYYSDFGDTPSRIIKNIILSPNKILAIIFQHSHIYYLKQLFLPVGFLSLLSPIFLLFAVPDFLINILSNNAQLSQIYYQYTATISPFLFITAIHGTTLIKNTFKQIPMRILIMYVFIFAVLSAYLYGPLPGALEPNIDMFIRPVDNRDFINHYLSHIPKRLSVSSTNNVGSHLSQRQKIYTIPLGIDNADIIVFLLTDPEAFPSLKAEKLLVQKLKQDKKYSIAIEMDKFIVFKKKGL